MKIKIIFSMDRNRVIGVDNQLPWHLPGDMKYFRENTSRCAITNIVLMGRKTWDSIPEKFRPLPGRLNVVFTRDLDFKIDHPNVIVKYDFIKELEVQLLMKDVNPDWTLWIIGGSELYRQALPYADEVYLTDVKTIIEPKLGQEVARAPNIDNDFKLIVNGPIHKDLKSGIKYQHKVYSRK